MVCSVVIISDTAALLLLKNSLPARLHQLLDMLHKDQRVRCAEIGLLHIHCQRHVVVVNAHHLLRREAAEMLADYPLRQSRLLVRLQHVIAVVRRYAV